MYERFGTFSYGKKTQTAGTVIVRPVWPWNNPGAAANGTGDRGQSVAHVATFSYVIGTTGHTLTVMRPFSYTTFSADAAASQAVVNLTDDPGKYSTNYKYALPNGANGPRTANNVIAANDYVGYQCADGTWVLDTVSSVSTLAVTLATNLPTGGVKQGGLCYFFGITTDTDPATAEVHPQFDIQAASSGTTQYTLQDGTGGLWHTLHPGDPLVFHSSNGTTAGTFELIAGFHARR